MRSRPFRIAAAISLTLFVATFALTAWSFYRPWVINRNVLGNFRVEAMGGNLAIAGPITYVYPSGSKTVRFAGFIYMTSTMQSVVIVPLWAVLLAAGASFLTFRRLDRLREKPGLCPSCGYDLRATPERCPECGLPAGAEA